MTETAFKKALDALLPQLLATLADQERLRRAWRTAELMNNRQAGPPFVASINELAVKIADAHDARLEAKVVAERVAEFRQLSREVGFTDEQMGPDVVDA